MGDPRFDMLTEGQKECLRLFHARWEIKDIARQIGRSVVTVNQRLTAARRHLGVNRSSEAARLLVEHESRTGVYTPPIYVPHTVGVDPSEMAPGGHDDDRQTGLPLPFPTRGRPTNDLSFTGKMTYAIVLAALIVLTFGGAVAALSGLSELF